MVSILFQSRSAVRFHENFSSCCLLFSIKELRREVFSASFTIASAISFAENGSVRRAASFATSGIDVMFDVITHVPQLNASRIGMPNPSKYETYVSAIDAERTLFKSTGSRRPVNITDFLSLIFLYASSIEVVHHFFSPR